MRSSGPASRSGCSGRARRLPDPCPPRRSSRPAGARRPRPFRRARHPSSPSRPSRSLDRASRRACTERARTRTGRPCPGSCSPRRRSSRRAGGRRRWRSRSRCRRTSSPCRPSRRSGRALLQACSGRARSPKAPHASRRAPSRRRRSSRPAGGRAPARLRRRGDANRVVAIPALPKPESSEPSGLKRARAKASSRC